MDPYNLALAFLLIAIGFLLLGCELFIPASGMLLVLSLAFTGAGVWLSFTAGGTTVGLTTLGVVAVAMPTAGALVLRWWPHTKMGRRMFLGAGDDDATVAAMPVNLELERLRGRIGRAASDLRPSGVTDFDGWLVDTLTEGLMVEAGSWVKVVDVKSGRVVVRPVERPTDLHDLENMDLS